MNHIQQAAEQYYPESKTFKGSGYMAMRKLYGQIVTHYEAFMNGRGYEMIKVEEDYTKLLDQLEEEYQSQEMMTIEDILAKAVAIGEARGKATKDEWIRVEDMGEVYEGNICWLSDGNHVCKGYKDGDKYRYPDDFPIEIMTPTHFMEIIYPQPPKTETK